jgi:hypothetical protein
MESALYLILAVILIVLGFLLTSSIAYIFLIIGGFMFGRTLAKLVLEKNNH